MKRLSLLLPVVSFSFVACGDAPGTRVLAVSAQYVVFVDQPPHCPTPGQDGRARITAGYHYFSLDGGLHEMQASEAMSFTLIDLSPADSLPTVDLRAFEAA